MNSDLMHSGDLQGAVQLTPLTASMNARIMERPFNAVIQMTPTTPKILGRIIKKSGCGVLLTLMGTRHASWYDDIYWQEERDYYFNGSHILYINNYFFLQKK